MLPATQNDNNLLSRTRATADKMRRKSGKNNREPVEQPTLAKKAEANWKKVYGAGYCVMDENRGREVRRLGLDVYVRLYECLGSHRRITDRP